MVSLVLHFLLTMEMATPLSLLVDSYHFPGAKMTMHEEKHSLSDYHPCPALLLEINRHMVT